MPARIPSYRLHKPAGQAVVTLAAGTTTSAGTAPPESRRKYDRLVAEWLADRARRTAAPPPAARPA